MWTDRHLPHQSAIQILNPLKPKTWIVVQAHADCSCSLCLFLQSSRWLRIEIIEPWDIPPPSRPVSPVQVAAQVPSDEGLPGEE